MIIRRSKARTATPHHGGSTPPPGVDTGVDRRGEAAQLMATSPGWLVLWSPYWQVFTAYELRNPDRCERVEAADAAELTRAMQQVERDLWRAHPHLGPVAAHIPAVRPSSGPPG
ncbi:hypothetical protein [Nonomuraea rhodomycinica]|uniref:Uncharacterized protein n=1 Tax=Nonomuraea rhodomycinica TaxID=1712872 RepID=A0A7Y6MHI5_9ACTN|nr:hypothetical protein [Nonomuraea rhodomycinica]NUW47014.1 hypothetical protein [Nonomuraea rhodomycinica]